MNTNPARMSATQTTTLAPAYLRGGDLVHLAGRNDWATVRQVVTRRDERVWLLYIADEPEPRRFSMDEAPEDAAVRTLVDEHVIQALSTGGVR